MNGEITKEAVSLMRRAAEITGNEEIKFAAAHIQSEYDKKHPRQPQTSGQTKKAATTEKIEKPKMQYTIKSQLPRSISAPDVSERPKWKAPVPNRNLPLQSQLPRKNWTPRTYAPNRSTPLRVYRNPIDNSANLKVTKEEAAQLQSIADRTKNPELKELSRKLQHIALVGGPLGPIHNVSITVQEASRLESLAAKSGSKELEDIARYTQSVAATSGVGVDLGQAAFLANVSKDDASHLQRAADITGDQELKDFARYAQSVSDTTGHSALPGPGVLIDQVIKSESAQLQSIADRTGNPDLKEFSKEVQSVVDSLSAGAGTS